MYGKIVVIKRNGADGAHFPLINTSCCFGRNNECDIRIQLPNVSGEHCKLDVNSEGQVFVTNVSTINPTQVNKRELAGPHLLGHGDIITIVDRLFRFEFATDSKYYPSDETLPTQALAGSKSSLQPLSPRSENVITAVSSEVSPKQTTSDGIGQTSGIQKSGTNSNPLDDLLDGLSPASFYKATTPKGLRGAKTTCKNFVNVGPHIPEKKTPSPRSQKKSIAGSLNLGSSREQRKSTSNLRRKSQPQFEENVSPLKLKRVSFGPQLSPEQFDKTLPPKTPVKRGATPRRSLPVVLNTPHSVLKRRSVVATIKEESSPGVFADQCTDADGKSMIKPRLLARSRSSSPRSPENSEASPSLRGGAAIVKKTATISGPICKSHRPTDHSFAEHDVTSPIEKPHDKLQTDGDIVGRPSRSPRRHSLPAASLCATSAEGDYGSISSNPRTPRASARTPASAASRVSLLSPLQKHTPAGLCESSSDTSLTDNAAQNSLSVQMQANTDKPVNSPVEHTHNLQQPSLEIGELVGILTRSAQKTPRNIFSDNLTSPWSEKNMASSTSPGQTLPGTETLERSKSPKVTSAKQTPPTQNTMVTPADVHPICSDLRVLRSSSKSPVTGKTSAKNTTVRSSVEPSEQSNATPEILARTSGQSSPQHSLDKSLTKAQRKSAGRASGQFSPQLSLGKGLTRAQSKSPAQIPAVASPVTELQIPGAPKRKSFSSTEFSLTPKDKVAFTSAENTLSSPSIPKNKFSVALDINRCGWGKDSDEAEGANSTDQHRSENTGRSSLAEICSFAETASTSGILSDSCDKALIQPVVNSITPKGVLLTPAENTCHSVTPLAMTNILRTAKSSGLKRNSNSPTELGQMTKTPRSRKTELPSPTVKRLIKTPKRSTSASPSGIARLMKTPKVTKCGTITSPSPSGIKRIFRTPAASKPTILTSLRPTNKQASPTGVKRITKTPRGPANEQVSPTGVKRITKTPRGPANEQASPTGVKRITKTPRGPANEQVSPTGVKRITKTPRGPANEQVSPTGVKRIMKTPRRPANEQASPTGVARLFRTPKVRKSATPSPSGIQRLFQTPTATAHKPELTGIKKLTKTPQQIAATHSSPTGVTKIPEVDKPEMSVTPVYSRRTRSLQKPKIDGAASPAGIKRMLKTPKPSSFLVVTTPSPAGLARLFKTPCAAESVVATSPSHAKKNKTPISAAEKVLKVRKSLNSSRVKRLTKTPTSVKKGIRNMSGIAELFKTAGKSDHLSKVSNGAGSSNETTDAVQTAQADVTSLVDKVFTSSADFNKMAALKTIRHKTWSEVVQSGVPAGAKFQHTSGPLIMMVKKKAPRPGPSLAIKKTGKTPKTPRTLARIQASSTGHVDSPETLVVGRMVSKGRPRTPRKSYGCRTVEQVETAVEMDVSLTGVKELFQSPAADTTVEEELYADIPDTPGGPGEMIVSPLSDKRGGQQRAARKSGRRSTVLAGIRNLFHIKRACKEPRLSGIRRLVATPRSKKKASPALSGVARLMRTPKVRAPAVESPSSIQLMFATPKTMAFSPGCERKISVGEPDNSGRILDLKKVCSQSNATAHRPEVSGEIDGAPHPELYTSIQSPTAQQLELSKAAAKAQLPDDSTLMVENTVQKSYRCGRRARQSVNALSPAVRKGKCKSACRDMTKAEITSSKAVLSVAMEAAAEVPVEDEKNVTSFKSPLPTKASKRGERKSRTSPFHSVHAELGVVRETARFVGSETAAPDISTSALTNKNKRGDVLSTGTRSPAKVVSTPVRRTGRKVTLVTPAKINYITPAPLKRRGRSRTLQTACIQDPSVSPVLYNGASSVAVKATRGSAGKLWDLEGFACVSAVQPATPEHVGNKIRNGSNTPRHPANAMKVSPSPNPVKLRRGRNQLSDNIVKSNLGKKGARAKKDVTLVEIDVPIPTKTRRGVGTKIDTEVAKLATPTRAKKGVRGKSAGGETLLKASRKQQTGADLNKAILLQSEGLSSQEICVIKASPVSTMRKRRGAKNAIEGSATAAFDTVGAALLQTESTRVSKAASAPAVTRRRGARRGHTNAAMDAAATVQVSKAAVEQSEATHVLKTVPAAAPKKGRVKKTSSEPTACEVLVSKSAVIYESGGKQSCAESPAPCVTRGRRARKGQMTSSSGLQSESKLALDPSPAAAPKRSRTNEKGQGDVLKCASNQKATRSRMVATTKNNQPAGQDPGSALGSTGTKRSATKGEGAPPAKKASSAKSDEDHSPVTLRRRRVVKNKAATPIKPTAKKFKKEVSEESASSVQKGKRKKASNSLELSSQGAVQCTKGKAKTAAKSNKKAVSPVTKCTTRSKAASASKTSGTGAKKTVKK